jgi:hypothetical protein
MPTGESATLMRSTMAAYSDLGVSSGSLFIEFAFS